jgi:hypothetical protein
MLGLDRRLPPAVPLELTHPPGAAERIVVREYAVRKELPRV